MEWRFIQIGEMLKSWVSDNVIIITSYNNNGHSNKKIIIIIEMKRNETKRMWKTDNNKKGIWKHTLYNITVRVCPFPFYSRQGPNKVL